ncbi:MAG: tetratricopeptide repeat protein [Chloroflexaceae bacterium]|nr:tetratricopeptide repeat protein [Chloroflexaceae bacterium]
MTRITHLLNSPACRLLTLVGVGGIGKTRLALHAATHMSTVFRYGACFVGLAALPGSAFLVSALGAALGIIFHDHGNPQEQLLSFLQEKEVLLVLDNFEHMMGSIDLLITILERAPEVKLLVTSRERLNIRWEWLLPLEGLAFPSPDDALHSDYSAIQLFIQRATQVQPHFTLTRANLSDVAAICRTVTGIPLAIELAAATVRERSCHEIATRLTDSLDTLASSLHDLPERHRTLRVVFDHSWNLLAPHERHVFQRLAVFRGGFRREAAEHVAGATPHILTTLVNKSLLRWTTDGRYDIHELLYQFAAEQLASSPADKQQARDQHSQYYVDLLEQQEHAIQGRNQRAVLDAIADELENIRAGWLWAATTGNGALLERGVHSLYTFYELRGQMQEGMQIFQQVTEILDQSAAPSANIAHLYARLIARQGWFATWLVQHDEAAVLLKRSLAHFVESGNQQEEAFVLRAMGLRAHIQSDYVSGQALYTRSLERYQSAPEANRASIAAVLIDLGDELHALGDYVGARDYYEQSLMLYRQLGNPNGIAAAHNGLGIVEEILGDYVKARQHFQESCTICREMGNQWALSRALGNLGNNAYTLGDLLEARHLCQESLLLCEEIGARNGLSFLYNILGDIAFDLHDYSAAQRLHQRGQLLAEEIGDQDGVAYCLMSLSKIALTMETYTEAEHLLQRSIALFEETGNRWGIATGQTILGGLCTVLERYSAARRYLGSALRIASEMQSVPLVLGVLLEIASLFAQTGAAVRAFELVHLVQHHPAVLHETRRKAEQLYTKVQPALPPETLTPPPPDDPVTLLSSVEAQLLHEFAPVSPEM